MTTLYTRRRFLRAAGSSLLLPAGLATGDARLPPITAIAASPPREAATALPRGVHLSWTGDPTRSRSLTWFTDGPEPPAGSVLEYGPVTPGMTAVELALAPFPGRTVAAGSATPGVRACTHKATASGLDAALPLRYRVGSPAGYSPVRVVAPTPNGDDFRFCHFGDHGQRDESRTVLRAIAARAPDFTLLAGDLSYANGDQPEWDRYTQQLQDDYAATGILMTAPGNHEEENNHGQTYRNRFACPASASSPDGCFYAFTLGRTRFVVSTGGAFAGDGRLAAEIEWLEATLAAAAVQRADGRLDFLVAAQHFTLWTDNRGRHPGNARLVDLQEGIFLRYGLDLLCVGHDHIYQRSQPMAAGRPDPRGYVQVTAGTGGKSFYSLLPPSVWSAHSLQDRHVFVEYRVSRTGIAAVALAVDAATGRTQAVDRFTLTPRTPEQARAAVQPVRSLAVIGAAIDSDYDRLAQRTLWANRLHRVG